MKVLRLCHIDLIGLERQHHRGFNLAPMDAKAVFMGAEQVVDRRTCRGLQWQVEPVHAVDQHAKAGAQVTRHHIKQADLAAV